MVVKNIQLKDKDEHSKGCSTRHTDTTPVTHAWTGAACLERPTFLWSDWGTWRGAGGALFLHLDLLRLRGCIWAHTKQLKASMIYCWVLHCFTTLESLFGILDIICYSWGTFDCYNRFLQVRGQIIPKYWLNDSTSFLCNIPAKITFGNASLMSATHDQFAMAMHVRFTPVRWAHTPEKKTKID